MKAYYLINKDCLEALKTIKDDYIDLCITSPPYYHVKEYSHTKGELDEGSEASYYTRLSTLFKDISRILKDDGVLCLNIDNGIRKSNDRYGVDWYTITAWEIAELGRQNLNLVNTIIWYDKVRRPSSSDVFLSHTYEPIFIFAKNKKYVFNKDSVEPKYRKDLWEINYVNAETYNLYDRSGIATYPVELTDNLIKLYSEENDMVLEPFMGSGTTLESCIKLRRNMIGTEISKEYFNNCVNRAKQFLSRDDVLKVF